MAVDAAEAFMFDACAPNETVPLNLEEFNVPFEFDDLSEIQLAYIFTEERDVHVAKKLEHAVVSKWKPLPDAFFLLSQPDKNVIHPELLPLPYGSAHDERFSRMHAPGAIGEVELFLRACKDFFGNTWVPLRAVREVAIMLQLSCVDELTSLPRMTSTGTSLTQGTWFAYWCAGKKPRSSGVGVDIYVQLAPEFFGVLPPTEYM